VSALRVACAAETNYIPHSAAMLHSVVEQSGGLAVEVHYLHGPGLPAEPVRLLRELVEGLGASIAFHEIADKEVAGLPTYSMFTSAMWYRTFLPELLADADRVLYLDVDTIAADSLEPLWQTDLTGHWLGAVTNVFQHNHLHRPGDLGLAADGYFNSGVLLMNLAEMRRDRCSFAVRECAAERGEALEWPDQDALNLVLAERRLALHPRWNCMNAVLDFPRAADVFGPDVVAEARRRPGIRHYEGPRENKPWSYLCPREMRDLYLRHRRATPWPAVPLEDVSLGNAARRWLRGPRRRTAWREFRTGTA
jgi:UDP-glucose:(glucosyl)LPS alpha-1,3-glucosyltransferase/UDP-D-galactose:(glucosyl)LPS alpha-1,3-D-galactosyltransferase/UDP-glucose:(galactosyl)LPS alpha-1,2-glucosyltransferase